MRSSVLAPLLLTLRLWLRFWPQLMLLVLLGILISDWLLELSVRIGLADQALGFAALTPVVLTKLIVTVLMFHVMRPALPAVTAAGALAAGTAVPIGGADQREGSDAGDGTDPVAAPPAARPLTRLAAILTVALVPFFAYYAAWGFLGDTIRAYSIRWLELYTPGESGLPLDALGARWLLVSVIVTWILRRLFKAMRERSNAPIWHLLIVMCETNWVFIGLYALSRWKGAVWAWVGSGGPWIYLRELWSEFPTPITTAFAASTPVEAMPPGALTMATDLFFYALLPVVWLVMAALIYGYDVAGDPGWARHRLQQMSARYNALPSYIRNFIDHFIRGYRSRYLPIVNAIRLTFGANLVLILVLIVGWHAIGWGADWLWLGATRLIGPHPLDLWQVLNQLLSLLFGSLSSTGTATGVKGILGEPLRFCLVAAVAEAALATAQAPRESQAESSASG